MVLEEHELNLLGLDNLSNEIVIGSITDGEYEPAGYYLCDNGNFYYWCSNLDYAERFPNKNEAMKAVPHCPIEVGEKRTIFMIELVTSVGDAVKVKESLPSSKDVRRKEIKAQIELLEEELAGL